MKSPCRLIAFFVALSGPFSANGAEVTACVVADNLENNPTYFGMATTVTKLKCEGAKNDFFPTLQQLYQLGWRLVEIVGGDHAISYRGGLPSPLYFLERTAPVEPQPEEEGSKKKAPDTSASGGAEKK